VQKNISKFTANITSENLANDISIRSAIFALSTRLRHIWIIY